ncbi:MAG: rhamnulokinase family protein [Chloroflexota bacterium]
MPLSLLAFDLGAESGRAIAGQFNGRHLTLTETHRFANTPVRLPHEFHWNILGLWSEILQGIVSTAELVGEPLAGIGLDTWGVDFALLDDQGHLVGNPYHYRDGRTDGMMTRAFEIVPRTEIFQQTGIQFMQINSLYQLLSLVETGSPALETARTFLMIPDLLNYWLCGVQTCEFSNATTTQCYDPQQRDWAYPLLSSLGIPESIFPAISHPGTVLGPLAHSVSEMTGVGSIPVIAPACHDTGSAVAAVPAASDHYAWISSGTWSIVGVNVKEPVISDLALRYNLTNEGGVHGDFRLSKNVMGLWLVQECRRTWANEGRSLGYDELTRMAAEAAPLQSIIDPDVDEFLKPGDMPARIREFCAQTGQPVPQDEGAVIRCALDSIALKYRWVVEHLEAVVRYRLETVHIVGGGTRNELLSQLTADCLERPVVTGPVEATAIGNLLAQAIALGQLASWDEAREVVIDSFPVKTFEPQPDSADWDSAYERLGNLIAAVPLITTQGEKS